MKRELVHQLRPGDVFLDSNPGSRVSFTLLKLTDSHVRFSLINEAGERWFLEGELFPDMKSMAQSKKESIIFQAFMKDFCPPADQSDCIFLRLRSPTGGVYIFRYNARVRVMSGSFLRERVQMEPEMMLTMRPQRRCGYCSKTLSTI